MRYLLLIICGLLLSIGWVSAQGNTRISLYVSTTGDDTNNGITPETAFRTITRAWNQIPMGVELTQGYDIIIAPGTYTAEEAPNYWESRYGTEQAPIYIGAEEGQNTVYLPTINAFDIRHVTFISLNIEVEEFDPFHCERCIYLTLRAMTIRGADPETYATQEAVKINQSQYVSILSSDISGGWDNAIDLVAVQYVHVINNNIYNAGDWCAYAKGGSAYIYFQFNEVYDCGTGGITLGQGTGFQFMTPPWIQYEVYDAGIIENYIHDTGGAGIGVQGGYQILISENALQRVGERSHVMEFGFGQRTCDGSPDSDDPVRQNCDLFNQQGGWGNSADATDGVTFVRIPNKHVYVYNNIVWNEAPYQSGYQHFFIPAPYEGDGQANSNLGRVVADEDLRIVNNIIINGDETMLLGVETNPDFPAGCQSDNPTCNETQLRTDNVFDDIPLQIIQESNGWELPTIISVEIPDFPAWDVPVPSGQVIQSF